MRRFTLAPLLFLPALVLAQDLRPIYDARLYSEPREPSGTARALADEWSRRAVESAGLEPGECGEVMFQDITGGSFTAPGAGERAVLWQCSGGMPMQGRQVGVVVMADGQVTAAVDFHGGNTWAIGALPDINSNGRDEILLRGGFIHMGESHDFFSVIEVLPAGVSKLGRFQGELDLCGTVAEGEPAEMPVAYRYQVRPGPVPTFYRERFVKTDCEGEWVRQGELEEVAPEIHEVEYSLVMPGGS